MDQLNHQQVIAKTAISEKFDIFGNLLDCVFVIPRKITGNTNNTNGENGRLVGIPESLKV